MLKVFKKILMKILKNVTEILIILLWNFILSALNYVWGGNVSPVSSFFGVATVYVNPKI